MMLSHSLLTPTTQCNRGATGCASGFCLSAHKLSRGVKELLGRVRQANCQAQRQRDAPCLLLVDVY